MAARVPQHGAAREAAATAKMPTAPSHIWSALAHAVRLWPQHPWQSLREPWLAAALRQATTTNQRQARHVLKLVANLKSTLHRKPPNGCKKGHCRKEVKAPICVPLADHCDLAHQQVLSFTWPAPCTCVLWVLEGVFRKVYKQFPGEAIQAEELAT